MTHFDSRMSLAPGCLLGVSWVLPGCLLGASWMLKGALRLFKIHFWGSHAGFIHIYIYVFVKVEVLPRVGEDEETEEVEEEVKKEEVKEEMKEEVKEELNVSDLSLRETYFSDEGTDCAPFAESRQDSRNTTPIFEIRLHKRPRNEPQRPLTRHLRAP